jgi:hypothetical protein
MKSLLIFLILAVFLFLVLRNYDLDGKQNGLNNKSDMIKKLLRQSSRWSVAADQDELPMISLLHANYGAGYLWSLKEIATNEEIEKTTGIDLTKFEKEITTIQDKATRKVYLACPQFGPDASSYLVKFST